MINETLGLKLAVDATAWRAMFDDMRARWGNFASDAAKASKSAGEGIQSISEKLDHLNGALELIKKGMEAFDKASELAHFAAELDNLNEKVPVERLRMMQDATEGAVTKVDLMKFSLKAMSGELHVTEAGLNVVLKAANTLGDEGFGETMEIAQKLMDSLRKGSSRELREFGVALKDTEDKQANMNAELKKFQELANKEVHVNEGLKQIERAQAAWKDFINDVKSGLGQIVITIGDAINKLLGLMPKSKAQKTFEGLDEGSLAYARGAVPDAPRQPGEVGYFQSGGGSMQRWTFNADAANQMMRFQAARAQYYAMYAPKAAFDDSLSTYQDQFAQQKAMQGPLVEGSQSGPTGPSSSNSFGNLWSNLAKKDASSIFREGGRAIGNAVDPQAYGGPWQTMLRAASTTEGGLNLGGQLDDFLAQGKKINDIEDQIKDKTSILGGAFDSLSSGLAASVDAAITGSDNIGKAFLKASAMALKSIAIESTVRAAFELAMGLASSIFAPGDAARHFAAAGQFAITAAIAGTGAALLGAAGGGFGGGGGGGGGGSPTTPAGNGAVSSGSAPVGPASQNFQIYIGDGFVGRPDELGKQITESINAATKQGRSSVTQGPASVVSYRTG